MVRIVESPATPASEPTSYQYSDHELNSTQPPPISQSLFNHFSTINQPFPILYQTVVPTRIQIGNTTLWVNQFNEPFKLLESQQFYLYWKWVLWFLLIRTHVSILMMNQPFYQVLLLGSIANQVLLMSIMVYQVMSIGIPFLHILTDPIN